MSINKLYWLSYDARGDHRRPRRKWPWILLLAILLLAAALAPVAWFGANADTVNLSEPAAIQVALPALLSDNMTVVYVVDDSDSMYEKLSPLHQALSEVAVKHSENSEVAVMLFGESNELLFDFTEPSEANWDTAVHSFTGTHGRTNLFQALMDALDTMPSNPTCVETSHWLVFKETICRERRIILMSDGRASDPHLFEDALRALVPSGIPVDTVAFGDDADRVGLQAISDATGGRFVEAH